MSEPIVVSTGGAVRGRSGPGYSMFLGIPYAAPPTGIGRFAEPGPHPRWPEVRDATQWGPAAPQAPRGGFGAVEMSPYFGDVAIQGDDYLTLNVWTPDGASDCPVMVFVHGGGFVSGSTRSDLYDGAAFARDGVVLVTVSYRLGIIGFLDLPDAPPNRGLLDVMAALNWVRTNIASFGGDPSNVTLFGQSAGATITAAILAERDAPRLIRRAIVQSGNGLGAFSREQAARVTHHAAALLNVDATAAGFSSVPDHQLVTVGAQLAGLPLRTARRFDPLIGLSAFSVVSDLQPADAVDGGAGAEISLLIGTNSQEGNLYLVPQGTFETSTERDVYELAAQTHPDPAAVVHEYRTRRQGASWGELRSAILGDALFVRGSQRLADAHASHGDATTHRYEFSWRSPAVGGRLGAAHTVELPFVFDRLDIPALRGPHGLLGAPDPSRRLATQMHDAWVRYSRTGDPGWDGPQPHHFSG
jgi:para-nitrobenzyl esterase